MMLNVSYTKYVKTCQNIKEKKAPCSTCPYDHFCDYFWNPGLTTVGYRMKKDAYLKHILLYAIEVGNARS